MFVILQITNEKDNDFFSIFLTNGKAWLRSDIASCNPNFESRKVMPNLANAKKKQNKTVLEQEL